MDKMEMSKKLEQLVSNAAAKENRLEMTEEMCIRDRYSLKS